MADRNALGKLGLTFGIITAAVMFMAVAIVKANVDGRFNADGTRAYASLTANLR